MARVFIQSSSRIYIRISLGRVLKCGSDIDLRSLEVRNIRKRTSIMKLKLLYTQNDYILRGLVSNLIGSKSIFLIHPLKQNLKQIVRHGENLKRGR